MKRYLKLVNFEFTRFFKFYLILIGITILSQVSGVILESRRYLKQANELIYKELMPMGDFIEQYGAMSFFNIVDTLWFTGPIALSAVVLIIYVFFIWYRDWLGKNTFSYRLLTLPIARIHIYWAKATTVLLYVLGLVALQLLLLSVESRILQWLVPSEFRVDVSVSEITNLYYLNVLFPSTLMEFVLNYGVGMMVVLIVFTAILFERSYRMKGIFYGMLYCALSLFIFIMPVLLNVFVLNNYFYLTEVFVMGCVTGLLVLSCAIWTGNYLMKNKLRV